VWIKGRTNTTNHVLVDAVRGSTEVLETDSTAAAYTDAQSVKSFDADGFTLGTSNDVNNSASGFNSYVAWCWKAGGTPANNTDGSITSSVSANQDAGFSIVSYTGTGANATVGHGLGVATSSTFFQNTSPSSTVISIGTSNDINKLNDDYIMYCFAEKSGVSKFGSYTGNGSSTGPFIECGFKPRLVICKRTDAASNWFMYDTVRGTNNKLYADDPSDENGEDGGSTSSNTILSLSTGFQMTSGNGSNTSGGTYIFMAWAENFSADADFKSLNTANLPAPEIKDGSDYFDTLTYTGPISSSAAAGTTGDVTGLASGFTPDLVWIKCRNQANFHQLFDQVRGVDANGAGALNSNSTDSEVTTNLNGGLSAFNDGGFTVIAGSDTGGRSNNTGSSDRTYAAWCWDAGGTGSTNTDGSITSTVSANLSAGFSIGTYTADGTNTNKTVGHGLGVAPEFIIVKNRDTTGRHWLIWHKGFNDNDKASLFTDSAPANNRFGPNAPTSTVFGLYGGQGNYNSDDHVFYAWAGVEGYSKFGSFLGGNGVFVYTGFKPAFLITKGTVGTRNWNIHDSARNTYNVVDGLIHPNLAQAEVASSSSSFDFLSNGFITRGGNVSGAGDLAVYGAFAENPFGGSGVSPATAR
jgi:hypothetical protein